MSQVAQEAASQSQPLFWFNMPRGFVQLDLNPSIERVEALVEQVLNLPDDLRGHAERVLQFWAGIITLMNANDVQVSAIGLHPDDNDGISFSVFTVSTVSTSGANPKLVLARLLETGAEIKDDEMRPLELPCGIGFLMEKERRTVAPRSVPERGNSIPEGTVWQGTVAVAGTGSSDITVLQLVTAALDLTEDYRNVLLGIAATLTFSNPLLQETENEALDSDSAAQRTPFG